MAVHKASTVGLEDLGLEGFISVVRDGASFKPEAAAFARAERSFKHLQQVATDQVIYGVNTGFGPMAQHAIANADRTALQYNLVRSHASGAGVDLPEEAVRAMLLVRAVTFLKGGSGVSAEVIQQLLRFLELGICPRVPALGGVGASGDLTQQAHLALGIIGEGRGTRNGVAGPMSEILASAGLKPVQLQLRDGLAMLNGTACMTAIGLLNVAHAQHLVRQAIGMAALLTETIGTWTDHLGAPLNEAKRHIGQRDVARYMREALTGSKCVRDRMEHLAPDSTTQDGTFSQIVQEHYSVRCVPQVIGPILDRVRQAERVLVDELHSIDDNPLTDPDSGIHHGGNFHGDQVALEMDMLRLAITKLCMLAERQLNFLLNEKVNQRFPAFLNMETLGLTLGMQGMQFVATSTTAENQALSTSLYVHSIPNNGDNQDIVSMGTNAACATARVLDNTSKVMSVLALGLAQAVDIARCNDRLSPEGGKLYSAVRNCNGPILSTSDPAAAIVAVERSLFQPTSTWRA